MHSGHDENGQSVVVITDSSHADCSPERNDDGSRSRDPFLGVESRHLYVFRSSRQSKTATPRGRHVHGPLRRGGRPSQSLFILPDVAVDHRGRALGAAASRNRSFGWARAGLVRRGEILYAHHRLLAHSELSKRASR